MGGGRGYISKEYFGGLWNSGQNGNFSYSAFGNIQPVSLMQEITVWNYETGCMQILGWKEINICLYASTSITPVQANFSGRVTTHIQNRVTQQTCQKLNTCITVHSVNCAVHNLQKED